MGRVESLRQSIVCMFRCAHLLAASSRDAGSIVLKNMAENLDFFAVMIMISVHVHVRNNVSFLRYTNRSIFFSLVR